MKRLISVFISAACVLALAQSNLVGDPVNDEAAKLIESRSSAAGQPFDLERLKALHHALAGGRPNVWIMPPEMLRSTQESVEPLREIAKQLAESPASAERYYGAVLNSYLKQTDGTKSLLLKLAHDDRAETAGTAMDAIFGLKIETPELRQELVAAMQEDKAPRGHSTLYSMAVTNVGRWGIIEALPILAKQLESSSDGTTPVDRDVVRQIKALGTSAASALPLLRRLAEKRRAAGDADFRELEDLDHAVLVVSGEYKAPQGYPIQPPPPPHPTTPTAQASAPMKASEAKPTVPTPSEEQASSTPWALVAVIVVAAIGLLWLLLKRRS